MSPRFFLLVALFCVGCTAEVADSAPVVDDPQDAGRKPPATEPLPCRSRFCESFEEDVAGQQPSRNRWTSWGYNPGPGTVVSSNVHSGGQALRMVSGTTPSWRYFRVRDFAIQSNSYYGRLYLFITSRPREYVHWNLISSFGDNENEIRYGGISEAHLHYLLYNVQPKVAREVAKVDTRAYVLPTGRWLCVEWMFDGNNDEANLWIDGFERSDVRVLGTYKGTDWAMANLRDVNIGWAIYQSIPTPMEVFVDDIALDDKRIRCN